MKKSAFAVCAALLSGLVACVPMPMQPPVASSFTFTPPMAAAATSTNMAIGILRPTSSAQQPGTFFVTNALIFQSGQNVVNQMLNASEADIERIIIAKGFTTAGAYPSFDEMTFGQKQRAALVLRPTFTVNLAVTQVPFGASTATVSGYVELEMIEPLSREKVWIKRLDLTPVTRPVTFDITTNQAGQLISVMSTNSITDLLNAFYQPTMMKMWDQLDTREIALLKRDSDKLKMTTQFNGGGR